VYLPLLVLAALSVSYAKIKGWWWWWRAMKTHLAAAARNVARFAAAAGWLAFGSAAVGLPILANFRRQLLSLSTPTRIMRIQCLAVAFHRHTRINKREPTAEKFTAAKQKNAAMQKLEMINYSAKCVKLEA